MVRRSLIAGIALSLLGGAFAELHAYPWFVGLRTVTVDQAGDVYAIDTGIYGYPSPTHYAVIQKYSQEGVYQTEWGGYGSAPGQMINPVDVEADRFYPGYFQGALYVLEGAPNYRIQKFNNNGEPLAIFGSHGAGDGQFLNPRGLGVDEAGNVYVTDADPAHCCVQKFAPDGTFLARWGTRGSAPGEFMAPYDVAVDAQGNIYVTDWIQSSYCRLHKYTSDLQFERWWSSFGCTDSTSYSLLGIDVDYYGNVYVADRHHTRIQVFDGAGQLLRMWGSTGWWPGGFQTPHDVAFSRFGYVYVADEMKSEILQFDMSGTFIRSFGGAPPTPIRETTWGGIKALF